MRSLTLAGIYLAPVVAFTTVIGLSGYSDRLVDYSGLEGQSVLDDLYNFDGSHLFAAMLDVAEEPKDEPAKPLIPSYSAMANQVGYQSQVGSSILYRAGLFDIQDFSLEAVSADFDSLIEAVSPQGGFYVSAQEPGTDGPSSVLPTQQSVPSGQASVGEPLTRVASKATDASPLDSIKFGGTGSSGGGNTTPLALSSFPDVAPVAATVGGSDAPSPDATDIVPLTAGPAAVPLPASALLLLGGMGLLGAFKFRRRA